MVRVDTAELILSDKPCLLNTHIIITINTHTLHIIIIITHTPHMHTHMYTHTTYTPHMHTGVGSWAWTIRLSLTSLSSGVRPSSGFSYVATVTGSCSGKGFTFRTVLGNLALKIKV